MNLNFCWTTLRVGNLENSLKFYHELLQLPISGRFGGDGKEIVMLGKEDQPKIELLWDKDGSPLKREAGISVGFAVPSLEEAMEYLKSKEIPMHGPISPNPHTRFLFIQDPDGFTVQLVENK